MQSNTGPAVADLELPEDVADFMCAHSEMDLYRANAPFILAGTRAQTEATG